MKILVLSNDSTYTYNLRREVLARLAAEGNEVIVVNKILKFANELKSLGCRMIDVDSGRHGTNPVEDVKLFLNYFTILKRECPDLVLSYNIKPNIYGGLCCQLLGIPYMPNITGLGTAVECPGKLQKLTTMLYKIGVSGATVIFFQNAENMQFFQNRNMMPKRAGVILLPGSGVNLESHPVLPYPQGEEKHFLFVARILREKGIDLYLGAAKRIRKNHPHAVFHICGDCDDRSYEKVIQQAQAAGDVIWHGHQRNMTPFIEQACCLVHPSYYPEGMSNVLLEAAACGRPIIATDRSGCRETVDAGKSGYVIPIKDEAALVVALEDFLSKPWEEQRAMGLAGRAKMEKDFDRNIVVQMVMNEVQCIVR